MAERFTQDELLDALAQGGDYPEGYAFIVVNQRELNTLANALTDAINYMGSEYCADCDEEGLCADHTGDVAVARQYMVLASELGRAEVNG